MSNGPSCASVCPVGALTLKAFRFQARVWNLLKTASTCGECSRGCSTQVEVLRSGEVKRFRPTDRTDKVPQIGWNGVRQVRPHPLFEGIADASEFYFVHSYCAYPSNARHIAGETEYGDSFTCAVARDNIFAVQFHPEKSQSAGLRILQNFGRLVQS